MQARTLVDLLRQRGREHPDRLAFTYLEDGSIPSETLTYGELDTRARAIATQLLALGATGERALLLFPTGLQFLAGFFGCLYAGVVGIPAPPPDASRLKRTGPRLRAIAQDAQASLVLSTTSIRTGIGESDTPLFDHRSMRWLDTDQVPRELADRWKEPAIDDAHLAYLQYTSG